MNKLRLLIFLLTSSLLLTACSNKHNAAVSLNKVLQHSLEHLLNNDLVSKEYDGQPLMIIQPENGSISSELVVNGKRCVLYPKGTNPETLLKGMDLFDPIPLVEIWSFSKKKDQVYLKLLFRATGHVFEMTLKGDDRVGYKVININQSLI